VLSQVKKSTYVVDLLNYFYFHPVTVLIPQGNWCDRNWWRLV